MREVPWKVSQSPNCCLTQKHTHTHTLFTTCKCAAQGHIREHTNKLTCAFVCVYTFISLLIFIFITICIKLQCAGSFLGIIRAQDNFLPRVRSRTWNENEKEKKKILSLAGAKRCVSLRPISEVKPSFNASVAREGEREREGGMRFAESNPEVILKATFHHSGKVSVVGRARVRGCKSRLQLLVGVYVLLHYLLELLDLSGSFSLTGRNDDRL